MSERQNRSTLGCGMMMLSPIILLAAIVLANTSNDSITTTDVVWSYIMLATAALFLVIGGIVWFRHR
jgi:hypothetical protein